MQKTIFMDKYPVFTLTLDKSEIRYKNVGEIVAYFKAKIEAHPIAQFIAVFDHYSHTKALNGAIMEGLLMRKMSFFVLDLPFQIQKLLRFAPRSVAICELENAFVIEFIEAPKEEMHALMETWAKELTL